MRVSGETGEGGVSEITNPFQGLTRRDLASRRADYSDMVSAAADARKDAERALELIAAVAKDAGPDRGLNVSDHAVLRYLERVKGLDVEKLRREIADEVGAGSQVAGDRIRGKNRFVFVIRGNVVSTVLPATARLIRRIAA